MRTEIAAWILLASLATTGALRAEMPPLRVCADPADLPYSSTARDGYENRVAEILADELGTKVEYFFYPQHKGFIRRSLNAGYCDAIMTLPAALPYVLATRPWFATSYVAITRADNSRRFTSFDDGWLAEARIGLPLVGNEGATTAPAVALSRRGLIHHIVPFEVFSDGDARQQGKIVSAVADGDIDVAFVWGPFGGFYAREQAIRLRVSPIAGDPLTPDQPFIAPMAIGVRKGEWALRDRLQRALDHRQPEIATVLRDFAIPLIEPPGATADAGAAASHP